MSFGEDVILPGPGEIIAGKYRIEGVVGRGGMGVVLAAQHVQLKQQVALKMLLVSGMDEAKRKEASARFVKEGQAAAQLTSEHVVRIFDVGTLEDGAPFMVMELLRGDDLATLIRRHGAAPTETALDYLAQACDAIGEAHALGIVHRDLKPSNLFVGKRSDGRAWIKVLDFGISKVLRPEQEAFEGDLTATRSVVGSPLYMSPEQLRDAKRVDPRTDVWSLGMVLYELLTGGPAFESDTLLGLTAAIAADQPVRPRVRRPDIPEELDAIVLKCLEKDPASRFQSISEFVTAITPLLPRGPVQRGAEHTSKRLESLLEAAAARALRDPATYRGSELEDPASALDERDRTAVSTSGFRPQGRAVTQPGTPPPHEVTWAERVSAPRVAVDGSSTLVSSTGKTVKPPEEPPPSPVKAIPASPPDNRRGFVLAFVACLLIAGVGLALYLSTPAPALPAPKVPAPEPSASALAVPPPPLRVPAETEVTPASTTASEAAPSASAARPRVPRPVKKPPPPSTTAGGVDIKLER